MTNRIARLLAAVVTFGVVGVPAAALTYSAEPIRAQVVDAETAEPLPEVIVLVIWELENEVGRWGGYFHWEETVSDTHGNFEFSGWGPKIVPRSAEGRLLRMNTSQPRLHFYKSGYRVGRFSNFLETWTLGDPRWTGDTVRSSVASGTLIKLKRFQGTELEYVRSLSYASGEFPTQGCNWARIPRLTAALVKEGQSHRQYVTIDLPTLEQLEREGSREAACPGTSILTPFLK